MNTHALLIHMAACHKLDAEHEPGDGADDGHSEPLTRLEQTCMARSLSHHTGFGGRIAHQSEKLELRNG